MIFRRGRLALFSGRLSIAGSTLLSACSIGIAFVKYAFIHASSINLNLGV
jgi:hypothetical protein